LAPSHGPSTSSTARMHAQVPSITGTQPLRNTLTATRVPWRLPPGPDDMAGRCGPSATAFSAQEVFGPSPSAVVPGARSQLVNGAVSGARDVGLVSVPIGVLGLVRVTSLGIEHGEDPLAGGALSDPPRSTPGDGTQIRASSAC
jgi:hypothetical protein